MPIFGTRRFDVHTKRTFMNPQSNRRGSNEELVIPRSARSARSSTASPIRPSATACYNCFKVDEIADARGFTKLGIQKVGQLVTRGVLIDVAALKGVEMLPDTYEITVEDLQQALEQQNLTLQPGDAVIIHTGWGKLWGKDNARYREDLPGIGIAAARMADGRTRCWSARTTGRSRCRPIPIRSSRCPCTRSCWSSTAFTCSRI